MLSSASVPLRTQHIDEGSPQLDRSSWIIGAALTAGYLGLYLLTLCPTVFWYDSAEYAAAARTLGIPHPPGYPVYTLVGHLFTWLPSSDPAWPLNLMSAVFGAGAVGLTFTVIRQLGARPLAAACGAASLGSSALFWNQCIIAEVYAPGLFVLMLVLLLVLRGLAANRGGLLVLAAAVAGIGLGVHLFIATCGLGLGLLVWSLGDWRSITRPGELRLLLSRQHLGRRAKVALACLGATALGSCVYLYLPLRSAMNPLMNFGDPSSPERFLWVVTGGNYKGWFLQDYPLGERALQVATILYDQLLVVGVALAAAGLVHTARRAPALALGLLLMAAGNLYFFFNYRVHDLEVFFLPAVAILCVLVGLGVDLAWSAIDARTARQLPRRLARVALLAFPLSLTAANFGTVDLSGYTAARDYGEELCAQLPRRAVIINFTTPPEWKNNAVFSSYFQAALGRRRDVVVVELSALEVLDLLVKGRRVYAYYPVKQLVGLFELRKEGALYRVVRPRPRPQHGVSTPH